MTETIVSIRKKSGRFLPEIFYAVRFGMVGSVATAVHIATLWLLLSGTSLPVLIANTAAFILAFGFSFAGNYVWTFGAPCPVKKALGRFLVISVSAFLLNTLCLGILVEQHLFPPKVAGLVAATLIPVATFLASRLWGFRQ